MRIGKALLAAVLVPVAVYAGLKSYVYTQARATVQRYIEQAAPFVAVEYRGIGSTLPSGTVQIEGLTFRPQGIPDTITVHAVVLRAGSMTALYRLMRDADSRTPPESLSLAVRGASLSLDGALARASDNFLMLAGGMAGGLEPLAYCGNERSAPFALLRRLGYETLRMDMQVGYDLKREGNTLAFGVEINIADMNRVSIDAKVAGVSGATDFKTAQLKEFGLAYKDLSYKDRVQRFCTQAAKISDSEYIKAELEQGAFSRAGIVPGPGLIEAYREFLTGSSSEIKVRAYPTEGFDPKALAFYQPADVLQQLNAQVTVNNKRIEDLSFSLGRPALAANPPPEPAAVAPPERAVAKDGPKIQRLEAAKEPQDEFRTIRVADLGRYINQTVRLHPRGQPAREGVLVQVTGSAASVQRRFGANDVMYQVPLTSIERAEVQQ